MVCIGCILGIFTAAYIFNDEEIISKIKSKKRESTREKNKDKEQNSKPALNERFTDRHDGLSDDYMDMLDDKEALSYAENERVGQTESYDYALNVKEKE